MVLGNLIQINAVGAEDQFLYGNPQMTYFKEVFRRPTNFATNYSKIPFSGSTNIDFGSTASFLIPMKGDLLGGIYLDMKFKKIERVNDYTFMNGETNKIATKTSYVNGIGFNCIDKISISINGNIIQTLNAELIFMINELYNNQSQKESFYRMTKYYGDNFSVGSSNVSELDTMLFIPFFFSMKPSAFLPICGLSHSEIKVIIKFRTLDKCLVRSFNSKGETFPGVDGYVLNDNLDIQGPAGEVPEKFSQFNEEVSAGIKSVDVYMQSVFLDNNEKRMFVNKELSYLVELFHIGNDHLIENPSASVNYFLDITGRNPTKFIFFRFMREDVFNSNMYDNYTYDFDLKYGGGMYRFPYERNILKLSNFMFNNTELNSEVGVTFLANAQLYEKFKTKSDHLIYTYSFALNPTSFQPSGSINLSRVLHKNLKVNLIDESNYTNNNIKANLIFKHYTCYYNILIIKDGLGGLMYQ